MLSSQEQHIFDPSDPNGSKRDKKLFIWFKATADNSLFKSKPMKDLLPSLTINKVERNQYKKGYFHFLAIVNDREEIEEDDEEDDDEDGGDDDDKEDDGNDGGDVVISAWNKMNKLYIKEHRAQKLKEWEQRNSKKKKPKQSKMKSLIYYKYHFERLICLKNPVKFTGKGGQGTFKMNNKDITNCLLDKNIGLKYADIAQRHVVLSIAQSICVGINHKFKTCEIREGNRPLLNLHKHVKFHVKFERISFILSARIKVQI